MSKPEFVYTTYIETTPEKLWHALTSTATSPSATGSATAVASDWEIGSPYKFAKQGKTTIEGKVLAFEPPKRLSYSWDNLSPDAQARTQLARHLRSRAARQGGQADRDA